MDKAKNFLTQKLGPLPFWAWGLLLVAGIAIVLTVLKNRGGAQSAAPSLDGSMGGSNLPDALSPNASGSGSANLPANPQTTPDQQYTNNPPPASVFGANNSSAGPPAANINDVRWQPAAPSIVARLGATAPGFQDPGAVIPPGWAGGAQPQSIVSRLGSNAPGFRG